MNTLRNWNRLFFIFLLLFSHIKISAQCKTFKDSDDPTTARNNHMFYRTALKAKKIEEAYPLWKNAYDAAPAADGKRNFHYTDGRTILKHLYKKETDNQKRQQYTKTILQLYDQEILCYPNFGGRDKTGFLLGRKAFDMFYIFESPYEAVLKVIEQSLHHSQNNVEYILLFPYASIIVHQFQKEIIDSTTAREAYEQLLEIADYNIDKNQYVSQFKEAKEKIIKEFLTIEDHIFDCAYFKNKIYPLYKAAPNDPDNYRKIYNELLHKGCDKSDPFLKEIAAKDRTHIEKQKIKQKQEQKQQKIQWQKDNPAYIARTLEHQKRFLEAIGKYEEALQKTNDTNQKAQYSYRIAEIYYVHLKQYKAAKEHYLQARQLRPNWGKPLIRIGRLYINSARDCFSDNLNIYMTYLAAIEKFQQAMLIDIEVEQEAQSLIKQYQKYRPDSGEVFMRQDIQEGGDYNIGCIIQETVKVKVK